MKLTATRASFDMLRHIPAGSVGSPRGNCEGCGMSIWSEGGYRVPGLPGIHWLHQMHRDGSIRPRARQSSLLQRMGLLIRFT